MGQNGALFACLGASTELRRAQVVSSAKLTKNHLFKQMGRAPRNGRGADSKMSYPGADMGREAVMRRILARLRKRYGPREWTCWGDGISVLVDTILSQNTSAANSDAGFKRLRRRFRSWHAVADAPVDEVEQCIRISGLSRQKAPRIQAILQ